MPENTKSTYSSYTDIGSEVNPLKPRCRDRCWNDSSECEVKGSSFMFKGTSADNIHPQPRASPLPSPTTSRWWSHKGIESVRHFLWASSENKPGPLKITQPPGGCDALCTWCQWKTNLSLTGKNTCASVWGLITNPIHSLMEWVREAPAKWGNHVFN